MIIKQCRSCQARIVWLKTAAGKSMPVDDATVDEGDEMFDHTKHKSHFATCPNADKHRKRSRGKQLEEHADQAFADVLGG